MDSDTVGSKFSPFTIVASLQQECVKEELKNTQDSCSFSALLNLGVGPEWLPEITSKFDSLALQ